MSVRILLVLQTRRRLDICIRYCLRYCSTYVSTEYFNIDIAIDGAKHGSCGFDPHYREEFLLIFLRYDTKASQATQHAFPRKIQRKVGNGVP